MYENNDDFLLYNNLFINQEISALIYRRRSLFSFLIKDKIASVLLMELYTKKNDVEAVSGIFTFQRIVTICFGEFHPSHSFIRFQSNGNNGIWKSRKVTWKIFDDVTALSSTNYSSNTTFTLMSSIFLDGLYMNYNKQRGFHINDI